MTKLTAPKALGDNLRNHLLIAMPGMKDPLFGNSITYICDHSPQGAMGLVVNRALDIHLSDIFEQMALGSHHRTGNWPILAGGPVSPERGFVLHPTDHHRWQSSLQVATDITLTASRDIMDALAAGEGPEHALFILGYAGWSAGQLEEEIKENSWLTVPADPEILFQTPIEQRWNAAARSLGIDINLMPSAGGHA
jgi:putative transcriptional regulator